MTIEIVAEIPEGAAPPGLFDRARESRNWARTLVVTEFPDAKQRLAHAFGPEGKVTFVPPSDRGVVYSVFSENLDLRGTIWTIRDEHGKRITQPLEVVRGQTTKLTISSRVRLSVNATTGSLVQNADLGSLKHQFDDLTILDTVTNGAFHDGRLDPQWDAGARIGADNSADAKRSFYARIIDACHAAGIQVIVGFQHARNELGDAPKAFHKWMKMVVGLEEGAREAAIALFASALDSFVFGGGAAMPDADGLSFDIEHVPAREVIDVATQADFFTRFYRAMAVRMAARRKIVVVAVGQFGASSSNRSLAQLDEAFNSSMSLTFTKSHPYSMAKGVPNMILRPMAFGRLANANSGAAQIKWYREIVEYALDFHGLHPRNFQLIYEQGSGDGQMSSFGNVLPKVCKEILRPNRVGLAPFAHGQESWTQYALHDAALNPDEAPAGTRGQPVQFPAWPPP